MRITPLSIQISPLIQAFIKKPNAVCIYASLRSTLFSLRFKFSIFFIFVLLFVEMHKRRGKKLAEMKLNVDKQFFKYVI